MASLQLTVLGSGTSMGVPTLGCHCAVCDSTDSHDKRTRPSVMLEYGGRVVVIDTTPDFRSQAMREKIDRLDAVLYTHSHADHILGLDDIRPYNLKQRGVVPVYAAADTQVTLRRQFAYVFEDIQTESSVPAVEMHTIDGPIELFGLRITPVPAQHGPQPVLGFRFGKAAYLTDFSAVSESSGNCCAAWTISFWMPCATHRIRCTRTWSNRWSWCVNCSRSARGSHIFATIWDMWRPTQSCPRACSWRMTD